MTAKRLEDIDPSVLFSLVNTKLRDGIPSLEKLCEHMDWDEQALVFRLEKAGFQYDPNQNRWISR